MKLAQRFTTPWLAQRITNWLMPYIAAEFKEVLEPVAYSASITREMIEEYANSQGFEVVFDLQTGVVKIEEVR